MKVRLNNQNGSTLIISVFLVLIISIIGFSLLRVSANSLQLVDHERKDQAIYYIAEAGLNIAKVDIEDKIAKAYQATVQDEAAAISYATQTNTDLNFDFQSTFISKVKNSLIDSSSTTKEYSINNFNDKYSSNTYSDIKLTLQTKTSSKLTYLLSSTGYIGNNSRDLDLMFNVSLDNITNIITSTGNSGITPPISTIPPGGGVHVNGSMTLNGNITLNGTVYSPSSNSDGHTINKDALKNKVVWDKSFNYQLPTFPNESYDNKSSLDTINVDTNTNSLLLNEDIRIQNINSSSLTIDVGNTDRTIYLNQLNASGLTINVVGSGKLNIIVNEVSINSNGNNKGLEIKSQNKNVELYVAGNINTNSGFNIEGSIYVKENGIHINKDSVVTGSIYSGGDVHINGNSVGSIGSIYAPKSNVHVNGTANITTSIVANTFTGNGNATINVGSSPLNTVPSVSTGQNITTINKGTQSLIYESITEK